MKWFLRDNNFLYVSLAVFLPLALLFYMLSGIAVDNFWMIRAFDADESGVLLDIHTMYEKGTWKPLNYIYGTAHTYIALVLLNVFGLFKEITFSDVAILSRFVNFAAFVGTGTLLALWMKKNVAGKWIFLFLISFLFLGVNFRYAFHAKPEHLQTFFLVSSIFLFGRYLDGYKARYLFTSGLFAGCAFATKYVGLLLLVFLSLYLFCVCFVRANKSLHFGLLGREGLILMGGALMGVALLGPYLLVDFLVVYQVLKAQSGVIGAGYFFLENKTLLGWLGSLLTRDLLWWGLAIWLFPGFICFLVTRRNYENNWPKRLLPFAWVVFYLVYLTVMVAQKSPRFAIVIMPFLLYLVFVSLDSLEKSLPQRVRKVMSTSVFVLVFIAILYMGMNSWQFGSGLWQRPFSKKMLAGVWIEENVQTSSVVASDLYTYVPPEFRKHFHQIYLTAYDVIRVKPDYLVVSRSIMSRYLDLDKGEVYREGKEAFMMHYYLYAKLDKDNFPGYKLLKDFDEVLIYRKRG